MKKKSGFYDLSTNYCSGNRLCGFATNQLCEINRYFTLSLSLLLYLQQWNNHTMYFKGHYTDKKVNIYKALKRLFLADGCLTVISNNYPRK